MPIDATGQFRHNHESAQMHSQAAGKKYAAPGTPAEGEDGAHTEVHNHHDGTFHTIHNGERVEHESIGHMQAHLSKIHGEPGHKHFHAHHDGMTIKTHSGDGDSREHDEIAGAHQHMDEALGENQNEPDGDEEMAETGNGLGELY